MEERFGKEEIRNRGLEERFGKEDTRNREMEESLKQRRTEQGFGGLGWGRLI